MNTPFFSIIIPIYNAEKYIERCINSILIQSFDDFELLLIDDGSIDKSGQICDDFASQDTRIKVIHKVNGGVSSAREAGFNNSTGIYIVFVDSDDELRQDALKEMFELYKENNFDLLVTAKTLIESDGEKQLYNKITGFISKERYVANLLRNGIFIGPHGRMTKRDLFIDSDAFNIPKDIVINEDLIMNLKLGLCAKNILISNEVNTYNYYNNPNSASKNIKDLTYWDKVFNIIDSILTKSNFSQCKDVQIAFYLLILRRIRFSIQKPEYIKNKYLDKINFTCFVDVGIIKNYMLLKYSILTVITNKIKNILHNKIIR